MEGDDGLEKFVREYKIKLERERLELLMSSANLPSRVSIKSPRQEAAARQRSHTPLWTGDEDPASAAARIPRAERNQPSVGALGTAAGVTPDDPTERRRKQREYRRCLDEQIAEKRRIERHQQQQQEEQQQESPASSRQPHSYGWYASPDASRDLPARSASPPIRCHYRRPAHVSQLPARPVTARKSELCLDDLTELRRLYAGHR